MSTEIFVLDNKVFLNLIEFSSELVINTKITIKTEKQKKYSKSTHNLGPYPHVQGANIPTSRTAHKEDTGEQEETKTY